MKCPVCKWDGVGIADRFGDYDDINCPRCGRYEIGGSYGHILQQCETPDHLLCGVLRDFHERGVEPPRIEERVRQELIARILDSVPAKADRLLHYIAIRSREPGDEVEVIGKQDWPVVFGTSPFALAYYVDHLHDLGLIEKVDCVTTDLDQSSWGCTLTVAGWEKVESDRKTSIASDQGFVAMWFADAMTPIWKYSLKPGIEDAGYKALRVDSDEHNNKVCDKIIADIRESRFVVADFTGQRNGVYFEAGFAMGLGLPVIWTVRKDEIDNVHFDTRQYNHIVWEDAADLRRRLAERIRATIGKGPRPI